MSTNPFEVSQLWAGRLKYYNFDRGFGKIRFVTNREEEAFFHCNQGRSFSLQNGVWVLDIKIGDRRQPTENDVIWFVLNRTAPKGPRADYWGFESEYNRLYREQQTNEWKPIAKGLEDFDQDEVTVENSEHHGWPYGLGGRHLEDPPATRNQQLQQLCQQTEHIPVRNVRIKLYEAETLESFALRINIRFTEVLRKLSEKNCSFTAKTTLTSNQAMWVAQQFGYYNFDRSAVIQDR